MLLVAAACAGCVVLPMHVYVADEAAGSPVYELCSFNPDVPVGVKVEVPGLEAVVSVTEEGDHGVVRVRFDVPEGRTLILRETVVRIDARNAEPALSASIPNVNPAAPARYPETEAMQKLLLPVDAPLPGGRLNLGRFSSDRHYWVAARVHGRLADDVWITLPAFSLDGVVAGFPELHFQRRLMVGRALFNC